MINKKTKNVWKKTEGTETKLRKQVCCDDVRSAFRVVYVQYMVGNGIQFFADERDIAYLSPSCSISENTAEVALLIADEAGAVAVGRYGRQLVAVIIFLFVQ